MLQKIFCYVQEQNLIQAEDHILLGLSGGADSVCLLLLLKELQERIPFTLEALHVEHGIRGEASRQDAAFSLEVCKRLSVPCKLVSVNVPSYCKKTGLGTEEAARILRYEAFGNRCMELKELGKRVKIALAHHMEDQSETVLFQLLRGCGLAGLRGMEPCALDINGNSLIRPLLCVSKADILQELKGRGQEYCEDETNSSNDYSRNYIRNVVLPHLKNVNPQAVAHICETASRVEEAYEYIHGKGEILIERLVEKGEHCARIEVQALREQPELLQKEVIREMLFYVAGKKKDITATHVESTLGLAECQSGKKIRLPYGMEARREFQTLIVARDTTSDQNTRERSLDSVEVTDTQLQYLLKNPTESLEISLGENGCFRFSVKAWQWGTDEIPKKPYTKAVDYDKMRGGFSLRFRRAGDYLVLDGSGHRKKLKEYFIAEKIPVGLRDRIPLLAKGQEVLVVPEGRMGHGVRVTEETQWILEISYSGGIF